MTNLFIQKLGTLIDPSMPEHKHQEIISLSYMLKHTYDNIYILSNTIEKVDSNVQCLTYNVYSEQLSYASNNDRIILWQDCVDYINADDIIALKIGLLNYNTCKCKRFLLVTDLRYRFLHEYAINVPKLNVPINYENTIELTQAKLYNYESPAAYQQYVPLQIIPAIKALNFAPNAKLIHDNVGDTVKSSYLSQLAQQLVMSIDTHNTNIEKQYNVCFSTAGFEGLDSFRYKLTYDLLFLNVHYANMSLNIITSHIDHRMADLFLKDKAIKSQFDLTYAVPYYNMQKQLAKSHCQLTIGDALYDKHQLVTNKFVEGILANNVNIVVGSYDYLKQLFDSTNEVNIAFFDIATYNQYTLYSQIQSFSTLQGMAKLVIEKQKKQLIDWLIECYLSMSHL